MNQANPFNSEIPKFRSYLTSIAFERWYTSLKQLRNNISIIYLRITKWNLQQKYTNKFCDSLSFKLSVQGTRMKQKVKKKGENPGSPALPPLPQWKASPRGRNVTQFGRAEITASRKPQILVRQPKGKIMEETPTDLQMSSLRN